jgi:hypothetical protein
VDISASTSAFVFHNHAVDPNPLLYKAKKYGIHQSSTDLFLLGQRVRDSAAFKSISRKRISQGRGMRGSSTVVLCLPSS